MLSQQRDMLWNTSSLRWHIAHINFYEAIYVVLEQYIDQAGVLVADCLVSYMERIRQDLKPKRQFVLRSDAHRKYNNEADLQFRWRRHAASTLDQSREQRELARTKREASVACGIKASQQCEKVQERDEAARILGDAIGKSIAVSIFKRRCDDSRRKAEDLELRAAAQAAEADSFLKVFVEYFSCPSEPH
jgi:hypothetical protein